MPAPDPVFDFQPLGDRWQVTAGPQDLGVVVGVFDKEADAEAAALDLNMTLRWHLTPWKKP
jgi:hypothetical protein